MAILREGKFDAKLGSKSKLIAATAALGLGAQAMEPNEAEAMPRGVYRAISSTVKKGEVSSALKVLKGKVLEGNKTITDIRKGQGDWRAILFDDDTMMTVTNKELTDLSRAFGTRKYTQALKEKDATSAAEQAIKSLDYHYARSYAIHGKKDVLEHSQAHRQRLKEMGLEPPRHKLVFYKGRYFTMPSQYAEHLEELGLLKVEKEIK